MCKVRELLERTKITAQVSVREYFRPIVYVWKRLTGRPSPPTQPSDGGLIQGMNVETTRPALSASTPPAAIPPVQQQL